MRPQTTSSFMKVFSSRCHQQPNNYCTYVCMYVFRKYTFERTNKYWKIYFNTFTYMLCVYMCGDRPFLMYLQTFHTHWLTDWRFPIAHLFYSKFSWMNEFFNSMKFLCWQVEIVLIVLKRYKPDVIFCNIYWASAFLKIFGRAFAPSERYIL